MQEISIALIENSRSRYQSEVTTEDIERSISRYGQFSPIWVRPHPNMQGHYQVIFGNRRLITARKLGWSTIAANVVQASNAEALAMAFSENCDRIDFSDYEKALLLENLHQTTNRSYSEIAELIGRSPAFVSLHIGMLKLFSEREGNESERSKILHLLSEKHCRALAKIEDSNERWNTAKLAVSASLGVRELEKICNRISSRSLPSDRSQTTDYEEIKKIIMERVEGLSSRNIENYYASACEKHFSSFSMFPNPDREVSLGDRDLSGDDLRNESQAKDYTVRVLKMITGVRLRIQNLRIRVSVSMAFATMSLAQEFTLYGEKMRIKTRETLVFEKDSNWRLVHEHTSTADISLLEKIAFSAKRPAISLTR